MARVGVLRTAGEKIPRNIKNNDLHLLRTYYVLGDVVSNLYM